MVWFSFTIRNHSFGVAGFTFDLPNITGNGAEAIAKIPADVWTKLAAERESAVTLLNQVKQGVPVYMILPLVLVLGAAFRGYQTFYLSFYRNNIFICFRKDSRNSCRYKRFFRKI